MHRAPCVTVPAPPPPAFVAPAVATGHARARLFPLLEIHVAPARPNAGRGHVDIDHVPVAHHAFDADLGLGHQVRREGNDGRARVPVRVARSLEERRPRHAPYVCHRPHHVARHARCVRAKERIPSDADHRVSLSLDDVREIVKHARDLAVTGVAVRRRTQVVVLLGPALALARLGSGHRRIRPLHAHPAPAEVLVRRERARWHWRRASRLRGRPLRRNEHLLRRRTVERRWRHGRHAGGGNA